MKLYLSSYHLGPRANIFGQMFTNKKVGLISNALDFSTDKERVEESTQKDIVDLISLGLHPERLELRDYFHAQDQLEHTIAEFGGIWVRGGNSFILRRAMAYSGLDIILQKLRTSNFVYGGFSAGICVVAPTLKGLEFVDDPLVIPEGYQPEIVWEGLDFVPYALVPHYQSNHPESELIEKSVQYYVEHHLPYVTLKDGEDILEEIH